MLILGPVSLVEKCPYKCNVYNFTSFVQSRRLSVMPPPINGGMMNKMEKEYDLYFYSYINSNPEAFIDMMRIVYDIYLGNNVYILTSDLMVDANESLLKYIQQRYGYNGCIVSEEDDFDYCVEGTFSMQGLSNLDMDKYCTAQYILSSAKSLGIDYLSDNSFIMGDNDEDRKYGEKV